MYKLKTLITFKHRDGKMRRRGKIFDEKDNRYVGILVGYKLVEVIAVIAKKAKEVYKKKIVEPEKNKEKEHPGTGKKMEGTEVRLGETGILKSSTGKETEEIKPITTDQFKTKKRKGGIIKGSRW